MSSSLYIIGKKFCEVAKILRVCKKKYKTRRNSLLKKLEVKVANVGKPDIGTMSESEKNTFLSALFSRMTEIATQQRTELSVQRR